MATSDYVVSKLLNHPKLPQSLCDACFIVFNSCWVQIGMLRDHVALTYYKNEFQIVTLWIAKDLICIR